MSMESEGRAMFEALEAAGIAYMLVGAMAQSVYATPRFTADLDIQVQVDDPPPPSASTWLGTIIEERTHDPVFEQDTLIVHLPGSATPIELFLVSHWFTRQAFGRRVRSHSDAFDREVPVPTIEDHLLLKAANHLASTRSRTKKAQDLVDMEEVIERHGDDIDRGYLEETGNRLGVETVFRTLQY